MRFIPAYAGNSSTGYGVSVTFPVHPRLRGELIQQTDDENSTGGSSPLTRGTRNAVALIVFFARFIPAYAGNSSPGIGGILAVIGSSPLTRGTRTPVSTGSREPGFIPAYAGNSYANDLRSGIYSVHPRLRGELALEIQRVNSITGSSPLTRGTLKNSENCLWSVRFIPAYAGNSSHAP